MAQFIEGLDRQQMMLLPEYLDDYVDEHSPVRAIDAFADLLDLSVLGFIWG
jgi:transposase